MIKPPALKAGDTIGVVAPAGIISPHELETGIKYLEGLGFWVKVGRYIQKTFRTMAGMDRERASDLLEMFLNPEIKAIACARGGYGSARVIPYLDSNLIQSHPKVFVGSSDITVLLVYLVQTCGLVAFHGPMVGPNFGKASSSLTETFFMKILTQPNPLGPLQLPGIKILKKGEAEGRLIGGCLSLLCSAMGTPYEPNTEGSILFLEDVREPPYRIDRMLTQLKDAGKFRNVRGVLFGPMWECRPKQGEGYRLEEVILDVLDGFEIPMLFGVPSGHGKDNVTLPLGVQVRVSANHDENRLVSLEEAAVSANPSGGVPGGSS
jgi:muramoyltetrapeptide carboxypeptidase